VAEIAASGENTGILPLEGALIRRPSMLSRSEKGQGLAEYALILALIAILAVVALMFLSGTIQSILSTIGAKL
jgi:Flp pilus assembly pilin Flp